MTILATKRWEERPMNNEIKHLKNGDFEVLPEKQTMIEDDQYRPYEVPGARRVFWLIDGQWEHKGWLMPQVS